MKKLFLILPITLLIGAGCLATNPAYQCSEASDCQLGYPEQCRDRCPSCDNIDATDNEVEAFSRSWCKEQRNIAREAAGETTCAACIGMIENADQVEIKCINNRCVKK